MKSIETIVTTVTTAAFPMDNIIAELQESITGDNPRIECEAMIGGGGFGRVYRVWHGPYYC